MARPSPDVEARHEALKRDVQAALDQSERGRSEPLDLDSIKGELSEEMDEQAQGR